MLFGDGNDFEIYHDGSNTRLHDTGTGNLLIQSNGSGVYIQKDASESMARFLTDGAVTLYHDNSEKLETSSTGVNVTGDVVATDDLYLDSDAAVIHFGDDGDVTLTHVADTGIRLADSDKMLFGDGNDLQIYHSGSHSFIDDAGTGDLFIRGDNSVYLSNAAGTETKASFTSDGAVNLY